MIIKKTNSLSALQKSLKIKAYIPLRHKTICVGSLLCLRPPPEILCTNMLVSKNAKMCITPNANLKICVTPNGKPQRKSVEYRLRWVPNARFSHWPCRFHVVCPVFFALGIQQKNGSQGFSVELIKVNPLLPKAVYRWA